MLALVIRQLARGGDVIRVLGRNQFVVEVAIARILELELDHALVVRHLFFHTRCVDTHGNAREAGLLSYVLPSDLLPCSGRCMTFLLRTHDDPDAVLPLHDDDFTHVVFPFRHFRDQYRVSEISSVHRLHKQRIGIARWRGNGESVRATKFLSTESPVCPAARSKHKRFLGVSLFIHHIAGNRSAGLHQDLREMQLLPHLRLHRLGREPKIFLITTDFCLPFPILLKQHQRIAFRFYG